MEMEKNTITAGDQQKAREFNESVNHLYQPLDEWVKEDTRNRSYLLIVSCKEREGEDERLKFSVEQRQLLLNPDKKPSKFFLRWVRDAKFPDSIKPKIEEILSRTQENP